MGLAPGTCLGRFEIVSQIGAGGMGEVYRAHDPRLGRDVAIKILPESFRSSSRLRRFDIEARAAGALNHPNIVALHDLGEERGIPYVVTELLEGATLRARLERGPLERAEAIRISREILDALTAAHDKNIVHRDLKPENIFLVTGGRVKLLDFGLAKLLEPDTAPSGDAATVPADTQAGEALGTPGYMAPEQARGLPADLRADLFAFGVVLHEMLTGTRAFQRATPAESAVAVMKESVTLPDDAQLAPIIAVCLEKDPANRFSAAADIRRLLDDAPPRRSARSRRRRAWLGPAALAGVAAAGVAGYLTLHRASVAIPPGRHSVIVLGLAGPARETWRGPLLQGGLQLVLEDGDELDVVDPETTNDIARDLQVPVADKVDAALLARIRRLSGATYVATGSYGIAGSRLTAHAALRDSATGAIVATADADADATEMGAVALTLGNRLRTALHAGPLPTDAAIHVQATVPSSAEAQQLWGQLEESEYSERRLGPELRATLEKILTLDPLFAPAHARLANEYAAEQDPRAAGELQTLYSLSGRLPERARVDAEFRYFHDIDPERALARGKARWERHPACLECARSLAASYRGLKRWDDCLKIVERARVVATPATARLAEVEVACLAGAHDNNRAADVAAKAIAVARTRGDRNQLARLLLAQATIAVELGHRVDALASLGEARDLMLALRDRSSLDDVLTSTITLLEETGQLVAARGVLDEQAKLAGDQGKAHEGAYARELGWLAMLQGDYAAARVQLDRAYALMKPGADTLDVRYITHHLQRTLAKYEGDLPKALNLVIEDVAFVRDKGWPTQESFQLGTHLLLLARDQIDADRLADAQKTVAELQTLPVPPSDEPEKHTLLARLELYSGHPADAERHARAAIELYEARGMPVELARSRALLARALLARGDQKQAFEQAVAAKSLADHVETFIPRLEVLITHGLVQGWTNAVLGLPTLDRAIDEASRHGNASLVLEGQLARGQVLLRDGRGDEGRAQLVVVERDARAKGWALIARLAAEAQK